MNNLKTIKLKSNCDQTQLSLAIFTHENPKAIVVISHGMQENKKRYYDYLKYLNDNGYACFIADHRGHGDSVQSMDDLGHFNDTSASYIILDLKQVIQYAQNCYPDTKVILLGHSMGSLVARCFVKQYSQLIDGLIISGSPSYNSGAKVGLSLCKQIEKKHGNHYRSQFINKLAVGNFNKRFKSENNVNAWMCTDKQVLTEFADDPVNGVAFTLNGYENLFKLMLQTYSLNGYDNINFNLPILFIAGSDDPCIISESNWKKAQNILKKAGFNDISSILYPGMRHEVLNETNKHKVYEDTLQFINNKVVNNC